MSDTLGYRGQTVAGVKYVAEQVANDPVGAAKRVAAKAAIYWNENSAGQIGEDVGRVGLGSLAGSGTVAIGGKAIGIVGTGAVAAGRQVAPVAKVSILECGAHTYGKMKPF